MVIRTSKPPIDAVSEIENTERKRMEDEYGPSKLGSTKKSVAPGSRTLLLIILFFSVVALSFFAYKSINVKNRAEEAAEQPVTSIVKRVIPKYKTPLQDNNNVAASIPSTEEKVLALENQGELPFNSEDMLSISARERMLSSPISETSVTHATSTGVSGNESTRTTLANDKNTLHHSRNNLEENLQPFIQNSAKAANLPDRDLLITQGSIINCVLQTRIVTSQPGMTSCHTTEDTYSTSGRVVLLDKGSKVVGLYNSGPAQGQARVFVNWSRIETPTGVIIDLNSPGTGSLGEAGLGGNIETHFWKRFGGSIMMSFIGDLGDYASKKSSGQSDSTTIDLQNTSTGLEEAATEALKNSINIPPTLYKNHGDRVSIFVAKDLDFSSVYSLENVETGT